MVWTHSNRVCVTVRYHKKVEKFDRYTVSSGFHWVLSIQILEVEYKQAYKMNGTRVLVRKSKNIKPYQPILFYFGSNMHKAKWWTLVSYGISWIEYQKMSRINAGRWVKIEQPYLTSMTRTPKSKLFIIALPMHTLS